MTTRTWTSVGEELHDETLAATSGHVPVTRSDLEAAIAALEWQDPVDLEVGATVGLGLIKVASEFQLRDIPAVAVGGIGPYDLYGIRNRFSNGVAEIFFVDRGSDILPVASDFPIEET